MSAISKKVLLALVRTTLAEIEARPAHPLTPEQAEHVKRATGKRVADIAER